MSASRRAAGPPPVVAAPDGAGPFPAVVIGAEAYGINPFVLDVQRRLVDLGFVVAIPDYYHGSGPKDVEAYEDFTEVVEHIGRLDFTCGARDVADAIDRVRAMPNVDARRTFVWGYCTGGTLAWLAACMRGDLAGAVLWFPSQPVFHELAPNTPAHPIDLLWQLTCPTVFLYGDQDMVMSPELRAELHSRIDQWGVDAEVRLYEGANHAFSAPFGPLRHEAAAAAAWDDAVAFLRRHSS